MDGPLTHTSVEPLNWGGEELIEEPRVTGSVVEFSFGPCDDCYIATTIHTVPTMLSRMFARSQR